MTIDPATPLSANLRVLCVDDDKFIRFTIKRMLRSLGITNVIEAADGVAALEILEGDTCPDLVLCDMNMTPLNGTAFVRRLRASANPIHAALPVIMLTGGVDEAAMQGVVDLGASGTLLKPVSSQQLAECMNAVLSRPVQALSPAL